ncbi:MAG: tRNA (adenosine(37)-N6)-dimethylallyltransferase MiaA [Planctomycetes bacterium]|nr:tRNA (adenosine(37)-N6)-dimethylallyltransferase MiaA [Planctomycetota bacterium]
MSDTGPVWVLTGPTASGKSALAVALAERLGAAVLSMDSMAVYRRMDIGTAKPDAAHRARVPHHLIDLVEPWESFDVSRWCALAEAAIAAERAAGRQPFFVGGTPLYLMALGKGLSARAPADPALRSELRAREAAAPGTLHAELLTRDPVAAARIHPRDTRRLIRALEVQAITGAPISAQQDSFDAPGWRIPLRVVALSVPREVLHERVRQRTRAMLAAGLVAETEAILAAGGFSREAGAAIGYAEARAWLRGAVRDEEELRNLIRRATHRLIRRQTTWLRRIPGVRWIAPEAGVDGILAAFAAAVPHAS